MRFVQEAELGRAAPTRIRKSDGCAEFGTLRPVPGHAGLWVRCARREARKISMLGKRFRFKLQMRGLSPRRARLRREGGASAEIFAARTTHTDTPGARFLGKESQAMARRNQGPKLRWLEKRKRFYVTLDRTRPQLRVLD
jgi:hypothetical protein